nr:class I SAM-dependent methyltransferase [Actinopolymorpha rutila]
MSERLAEVDRLVIRDLGCGTGALPRWLASRLPGPQHWILHDYDADLLAHAAARVTGTDADGVPLTVEPYVGDLTALGSAELAGTSLVTASALLDLLTADEIDRLADVCVGAGCAALFTLSVTGSVELDPADPLDGELAAAFDDHQRRSVGGRRLLGPDAVAATVEAFERRGAVVRREPSPWRLGPDQAPLAEEWLRGWVEAACAQRPDLIPSAEAYVAARLASCAAGNLHVTVHHADLLAVPSP